jgi:hypothetical protein
MHKKLYGFTEKDELYSKMIREGKTTRDKALAEVSRRLDVGKKEMEVINQVLID